MPEMAGPQGKSGLRKITRSLSLDLATFDWTGHPGRVRAPVSCSVDLYDRCLLLAGLRRDDLDGGSGGCSGHLFGFRAGSPYVREGATSPPPRSRTAGSLPHRGLGCGALLDHAFPHDAVAALLTSGPPARRGRAEDAPLMTVKNPRNTGMTAEFDGGRVRLRPTGPAGLCPDGACGGKVVALRGCEVGERAGDRGRAA
jgi:hypothetical protein